MGVIFIVGTVYFLFISDILLRNFLNCLIICGHPYLNRSGKIALIPYSVDKIIIPVTIVMFIIF